MASRTALLITAAMAVVVAVGALLPATASAAVYRVGDDDGWDLDVDYDDWASDKDFKVGDILEFVYPTEEEEPTHDVLQVDVANYEACTVPGDARMLSFGLGAVGQYFFICGVEDRCESGTKLAINVH